MAQVNKIEIGQTVHKELPFIINRYAGRSLVMLGCGHTLWTDLAKVYSSHKGDYMGINRVLVDFLGPLEHAYGSHSYELLLYTLWRRQFLAMFQHMNTHSCRIESPLDYEAHLVPQYLWDFPDYYRGSSGLSGVLAALAMGYDEIILAGMPMDNGGYYCNPFWKHAYKKLFMDDWEKAAKNCFDGKVKSLSGNTRELLGAPKGF